MRRSSIPHALALAAAALGLAALAPRRAAAQPAAAQPTAGAVAPSHGGLRHVPPAEAAPGAPIELVGEVAGASRSTLVLHFRAIGEPTWRDAEFRRDGDRWIALIPADAVRPPGVEYYVDAQIDGGFLAAFASAALPHPIAVRPTTLELRRARELAARGGKKSRISLAFDWVDFGARTIVLGPGDEARVPDRYYRIDADWSYLVLRYPLESFRIGYSRLLGTTPSSGAADRTECDEERCEVGYKVGGFFELRFAFAEGVELDARAAAMATADGASLGGRTELRIGDEDASHVAFGGEVMADVGASAFFRLGWGTVPGLPMAATVEATDYPDSDRTAAVRLLYDVAHPFPNGLRLGARVGYQARDEGVGGVSAGLRAAVDF